MTDDVIDPTITPGSYLKTKDGFVRQDQPTAPADTPNAPIDADAARTTAEAIEASGFPVPPALQAAIDADKPARAKPAPAIKSTPPALDLATKDA